MPTATLDAVLASLPSVREAAASARDTLLSNLTMIGEIPSPTFGEDDRVNFIAGRLAESGLQNCSIDAKGNGAGVLAGTEGKQNILVVSNADTIVRDKKDQTLEIKSNRVIGPFVGDNAIALAAMCTLPYVFEKLNIRLKSNLVLLATPHVLGRGNLESLKHFLSNSATPFQAGICLESLQLGRLNYSSMGMLRGDIVCRLPDDYDWARFGSTGAIVPMGDIISRINQIPFPNRPVTTIILGSVRGGISYNNIARDTMLSFEARSESTEIMQKLRQQLEEIAQDVTAQSGMKVTLDVFAQREPGGIEISHPLVRSARSVMTTLGIEPVSYATTSLMSALRDAKIPAVTIGITTGERSSKLDEIDESVAIEPMASGLAQLAGILLSIDGGLSG